MEESVRKLSIKQIRDAADSISKKRRVVTVYQIARDLSAKPCTVSSYVNTVLGVKDELVRNYGLQCGVVKNLTYMSAARTLHAVGIIVTYKRIACLTKSRVRTVRQWFHKHRNEEHPFEIISEKRFKRQLLEKRILLHVERLRGEGNVLISVSQVARDLEIERQYLHRLLRSNPALRQRLGI